MKYTVQQDQCPYVDAVAEPSYEKESCRIGR